MDLIESMGWDESVIRNVNLRTKAKFNNFTLNWLREARSGYRAHYENCLEQLEPWVMNLLIDLDFDPDRPWPHHYDPDYDFLFGKVGPGLPETVWEGHTIFNSLATVPVQIRPRFMEHFNSEVERVY